MRVPGPVMTPDESLMHALSIPVDYVQRGSHLGLAALAGARNFIDMAHYPRQDAVDRVAGSRFYYHTHAVLGERLPEHGHFHLFHEGAQGFSHLAALSMDAQGNPRAWLATNQWVTGERWRSAQDWQAVLPSFRMHVRGRLAPVARWLSAMVQLYRQELIHLLTRRDAWLVQQCATGRTRDDAFQDRRTHVVCSHPVSLGADVAHLLNL